MNTSQSSPNALALYACPACKGKLQIHERALDCEACEVTYPIVEGIPDFLLEDRERSLRPLFRWAVSTIVRLYETPLWYSPILKMAGGKGSPSYKEVIQLMGEMMPTRQGLLLDVACGPRTWGRRLASAAMEVYGIDFSWSMLHQGKRKIKQEKISNMHFAHARVEALPFSDRQFDAAYCGGALHGFPDPAGALVEIGRTMSPGAPLVVLTFLNRGQPLLERRLKAEAHNKELARMHFFELPELEQALSQAGFKDFEPRVYGGIVIFKACKG